MLKLSGSMASIPALCLADPNSTALDRIHQQLPKTVEEWEQWLACVEQNKIEALTLSNITKHKVLIPQWVRESLEVKSQFVRLQNRYRREKVRALLKKFVENNIPVLLLKNDAISNEIYRDYDYTAIETLQLLIKPEHCEQVYKLYESLGFLTLWGKGHEQKIFKDRTNQLSQNWPLFYSEDFTLTIKTYSSLKYLNALNSEALTKLWNRSTPLIYENIEVQKLSNEDFIHFLCLNTPLWDLGAGELADIYNCLSLWKNFDWKLFSQIVEESNSFESVFLALSMSQSLYYLPNIETYTHDIRNRVDSKKVEEVERRLENPENILLFRSNYFFMLSKAYLNWRMENNIYKKTLKSMKLAQLLIWPPSTEVAHLNFETKLNSVFKIITHRIKVMTFTYKYFFNQ